MEGMANAMLFQQPVRIAESTSNSTFPHLLKKNEALQQPRKQSLISHFDFNDVSPRAKVLYQILTGVPPHAIDAALADCPITPTPDVVEEVLKLLYGSPDAAVKLFRWAGLKRKHSSYAWSLMVDLLGKNQLFEPMWDAIRSMKKENVLSSATFVSVFGSYCMAGRCKEAIMTFDVMEKYGVEPDVVAMNSLMSAICREDKQVAVAVEFFERVKVKISPDADTFAILLEGWEKEGNAAEAKRTFGEMVIRVGWSPNYMSAYDAFLTTLVRGSQPDEALKFLSVMKKRDCLPGLKFFSNSLDILVKRSDATNALLLWSVMLESGLMPDLLMYNAIISLACKGNDTDTAFRFLDEMVYYGAFPDSWTYNMIFKCLVKNKKVRETGVEIWNYMIDNQILPLDESAHAFLIGLSKMDRLSELRRYIDDMLDRRIDISESTMTALKSAFYKDGRSSRDVYDNLMRRWKSIKKFGR
uniref:Pentatricopeptide repeat-containing protein n=1 Tax=Kalanchoe fedtschenkoi TaxID=63787 RepID=A0A7N0TBL6_KALFE